MTNIDLANPQLTPPQSTQPRETEIGATEIGAAEIGVAEIGVAEIGVAEIGVAEIGELLGHLPDRVNGNPALLRRGHYVSLTFLLGVDDLDYLININEGRVCSVTLRHLSTASGQFTIRASSEVWREHWRPFPKRNYHDLFSMLPVGLATIDGDLLPLMQNLQYFKDVIASLRSEETDATV